MSKFQKLILPPFEPQKQSELLSSPYQVLENPCIFIPDRLSTMPRQGLDPSMLSRTDKEKSRGTDNCQAIQELQESSSEEKQSFFIKSSK
jgi:hypothetical protein